MKPLMFSQHEKAWKRVGGEIGCAIMRHHCETFLTLCVHSYKQNYLTRPDGQYYFTLSFSFESYYDDSVLFAP